MTVPERRQLRSQVLRRIYELVDGRLSESTGVHWQEPELYEGFAVDPDEIDKALEYLEHVGLLDQTGAGVYGLTRRGLDEIEDLIASPERKTANLAPLVVQHIHNSGQLAIAHGHDIAISQTAAPGPLPKELEDLAQRLRSLLGEEREAEVGAFLIAASSGESAFELAARAEPLAKASEGTKPVFKAFTEELAKELGKRTAEGTLTAGTWLAMHGKRVYDGISMLLQTLS